MMKSTVYVIPSLGEGFGVGAEEALLLGVKTIATDTGAHRELLENIPNNIIVKPGDVTELTKAIITALKTQRNTPKLDKKRLCELSCDIISKEILDFFNS